MIDLRLILRRRGGRHGHAGRAAIMTSLCSQRRYGCAYNKFRAAKLVLAYV